MQIGQFRLQRLVMSRKTMFGSLCWQLRQERPQLPYWKSESIFRLRQ